MMEGSTLVCLIDDMILVIEMMAFLAIVYYIKPNKSNHDDGIFMN